MEKFLLNYGQKGGLPGMDEIKGEVLTVDINKCFPNVWNPNEMDEFMYEKEKNSILTFGFLDPITVREIPEGYEIIDGEQRWNAAKDLGYTVISVNNLGNLSDSVAKQLTVIMNELKSAFASLAATKKVKPMP
jgi:ParB/RepB/Spo0J family partition protein